MAHQATVRPFTGAFGFKIPPETTLVMGDIEVLQTGAGGVIAKNAKSFWCRAAMNAPNRGFEDNFVRNGVGEFVLKGGHRIAQNGRSKEGGNNAKQAHRNGVFDPSDIACRPCHSSCSLSFSSFSLKFLS